MNFRPGPQRFPSSRTLGLMGVGYGFGIATLAIGYVVGRILSLFWR